MSAQQSRPGGVLLVDHHRHRQRFNSYSALACFGADAAVVLLFVALGRYSHDERLSPGGMLETGWPFAVGLLGGYVAVVFTRWPAVSLGAGLISSVKLVIVAMVLRYGIARDDVPLAFVVTSTVFLVGAMVGWRALALRQANGDWPTHLRTGVRQRSKITASVQRIRARLGISAPRR
ncbi:DUF3054 domain-containing protein [Spongisporangium articulatum]|uniref:DUF3054 domain-containing protein n=1 Tax=Spongisporangium articulatum TaxID=3362603 RepID=A0ABW8ATA6_9ACTN